MSAPSSRAQAPLQWMRCEKPNELGLFQQCERVEFLGRIGDKAKAYLVSHKKLIVVPIESLFQVQPMSLTEKVVSGQKVLLAGEWIWPSEKDSKNFKTLCRVNETTNKAKFKIFCGDKEARTVARHPLYKIVTSSASTEESSQAFTQK